MSDLICRKTMRACATPGMCSPFGGCAMPWTVPAALAAAPQPQPEPVAWRCVDGGACKHGSWCTEVYCQEHCQFRTPPAPAAQSSAEPSLVPHDATIVGISVSPGASVPSTVPPPGDAR